MDVPNGIGSESGGKLFLETRPMDHRCHRCHDMQVVLHGRYGFLLNYDIKQKKYITGITEDLRRNTLVLT